MKFICTICNIFTRQTYKHYNQDTEIMKNVTNILHYDSVQTTIDGELKMTMIKKRTYTLRPFGRFWVKWAAGKKTKENPLVIDFNGLRFDYRTGMPYDGDQEIAFCKYMKANHTDILTDGRNFYTRVGDDWVEVSHEKLSKYSQFLTNGCMEDNLESWEQYKRLCK